MGFKNKLDHHSFKPLLGGSLQTYGGFPVSVVLHVPKTNRRLTLLGK